MRKGFEGLAALVQQHLDQDPFSGQLFAFRGRRGDLEKVLSWDKLSLRDLIRGIVFGCEAVRDWELPGRCSAFCRVALRIGVIPQIKLYLLARNLTRPACADR